MSKTSTLFINSLDKGLLVLEAFRNYETLNLRDIAESCDISISSAQRAAYTLEQLGYIKKDIQTRRYSLTVKALGLGYTYLANEHLFKSAHATLHQLNQECGESVNLSVPDDDDMVFVMRIHTFKHIPVYMPIGARIPIFSSASGRAVLSCGPISAVDERLISTRIEKHTPHTTTASAALREMIMEAGTAGYAYADEEFFPTDVNVAAAVLDETHTPIAAINISVPKPRWSLARAREELAPLVIRAARAISKNR